MDEIHNALIQAWQKLLPHLDSHPTELEHRLARRNSSLLKRPPRAWCLAVRANDTRLEKYFASRATKSHANQVLLDWRALYNLCSPVYLQSSARTLDQVASELGLSNPDTLVTSRLRGTFHVRHVPGLGGKWGKPRPLLTATRPLDPNSELFEMPDPAWSLSTDDLFARCPRDLSALLTRVPVYRDRGHWLRKDYIHPELPTDAPPPPRYKSRKLPPPSPDYVWYKWKGDEYMGYDWRNPAAAAGYKRQQDRLQKAREAAKQLRQRKWVKERISSGSLEFYGHRWICPSCEKKVHMLFYPLAAPNLLLGHLGELEDTRYNEIAFLKFNQSFACAQCHHIFRFSRIPSESWSQIVSYLSGGLLFGREVPKPDWFTPDRKYTFTPKALATPSKRRPQIESLLLKGLTYQQIAKELNIHWRTVRTHARKIFLQQGLTSREQFLTKHQIPHTPPKRGGSHKSPAI